MKTTARLLIPGLIGILLFPTICLCAPKVVKEFTLPALDGVHFRPRICGDWIVSALNTTTTNNTSTIGIVGYNAKSGQNYTLFDGKGGWPEIDGSYVVWTGKSNQYETFRTLQGGSNGYSTASNLMMLDLNTRRYYSPRLRGSADICINIAGTVIAYRSGVNIYVIDMATGITKAVTPAGSKPGVFAIGGDIVAWMDTAKNQIRSYRISTGEDQIIADNLPPKSGNPDTDGKIITWEAGGVIQACDCTTGRQFIIAKGYFCEVDNGVAVYLAQAQGAKPDGSCGCGSAVFGKVLATGEEFRISKGTADQKPSISGNRVIWCKEGKIYCAELDLKAKTPHGK